MFHHLTPSPNIPNQPPSTAQPAVFQGSPAEASAALRAARRRRGGLGRGRRGRGAGGAPGAVG